MDCLALGLFAAAAILYWQFLRPVPADEEIAIIRQQEEIEALQADNAQLRQLLEASGESAQAISEAMPSVPELTGLARRKVLRDVTEIMNAVGIRSRTLPDPLRAGNPSAAPAFQLGSDGKLPARFGELFGLDAAAVARLQERLDGIIGRVNDAILANTRAEQAGPDVEVLHVASLGPQSNTYRQEFLNVFRDSLGEDGLRALLLLNQEPEATGDWLNREREAMAAGEPVPPRGQISTLFRTFGAYDRTITVTRNNGRYTFLENGENIQASSSNSSRATLVESLGAAAHRLPENF